MIAPNSNRAPRPAASPPSGRSRWRRSSSTTARAGSPPTARPVDCVRLAALGPRRRPARPDRVGHQPRLEPRRRHHLLRAPWPPRSRGSCSACRASPCRSSRRRARWTSGSAADFDFTEAAAFTARLVEEIESVPLPYGTLLNVNCPAGDARGARACRLGRRIYRDTLELDEERRRPQALPDLRRRPVLPPGGGHRLRGHRRRAASPSRRSTSTSRASTASRSSAASTSTA